MLPITLAIVAIVGVVVLGYALRRDATNASNARHATRETPTAQKRPRYGSESRIPADALTIYDFEG